jgi:hypothetical protein
VITLLALVGLLSGALVFLMLPFPSDPFAGFVPLEGAERDAVQAGLTGVYLTGNEPGQHGIVLSNPGELKLFELGGVEAPRIVYATYSARRNGTKLILATDQPGGAIEVRDNATLVYGGETYRRIP